MDDANNITVELVTGSRIHLTVAMSEFEGWLDAALATPSMARPVKRWDRQKSLGMTAPVVTILAKHVVAVYPTVHGPDNPVQQIEVTRPGEAATAAYRAIQAHLPDLAQKADAELERLRERIETLKAVTHAATGQPDKELVEAEDDPCTCIDPVDVSDFDGGDPFCPVHGAAERLDNDGHPGVGRGSGYDGRYDPLG